MSAGSVRTAPPAAAIPTTLALLPVPRATAAGRPLAPVTGASVVCPNLRWRLRALLTLALQKRKGEVRW
jgi:hypothetical protein